MALTMNVTVKADMRKLSEIRRKLIKAAEQAIQVGFFDGVPHPNAPGRTIAEIAAINEFGLPSQNIPERPFMLASIRDTSAPSFIAAGFKKMINGTGSVASMRSNTAKRMRDEMKITIIEFSEPGNAPFTIAKKGFDNPLTETGTLAQSVKFKIGRRR